MTPTPPSPANSSDPSLAQTLAALEEVADRAGQDRTVARSEGERLAAAVAEAATGAAADWNSQTGGSGTQAFFDAASKGRRWRASPTTLLSQLVLERSSHATAYAQALAEVCASARTLGEANPRVVGNASVAASSQLAAVRPAAASAPQDPEPDRYLGLDEGYRPFEETSRSLLDMLETTSRRLAEMTRSRSASSEAPGRPAGGSTLDLPPDLGGGPVAFPGLGNAAPKPTAPAAPVPSATDQPEAASTSTDAEPEPEPEPKSLDELLAELDALIGLSEVKAEIHRQVAMLRVERLRTKAGLRAPTITRHLVFVGNPGTGKTTVARLVGGIYRALGLLGKGQLVEVDRSELVAGYLGQTAIKTSEVVAKAVGGVLFIDEAYSLAGDQYGTEAVDTLVKEMEDHRDDLVLIVAGYPEPMAVFVAQNPGLASRFRTTIEFADYSDNELVQIFTTLASQADYDVTEDCRTRFETILRVTPRGHSFGNGRFARNHLEAAIGRHAWRLRDIEEPTVSQLRELIADDLDPEATDDVEAPDPAPEEQLTAPPLKEEESA